MDPVSEQDMSRHEVRLHPNAELAPDAWRELRRRTKEKYRDVYDRILELMDRHDMMNIGYTIDEYEPEVVSLLPRLGETAGPDDVRRVLHAEFTAWFSPVSAGSESRFDALAREIWEVWRSRVKD